MNSRDAGIQEIFNFLSGCLAQPLRDDESGNPNHQMMFVTSNHDFPSCHFASVYGELAYIPMDNSRLFTDDEMADIRDIEALSRARVLFLNEKTISGAWSEDTFDRLTGRKAIYYRNRAGIVTPFFNQAFPIFEGCEFPKIKMPVTDGHIDRIRHLHIPCTMQHLLKGFSQDLVNILRHGAELIGEDGDIFDMTPSVVRRDTNQLIDKIDHDWRYRNVGRKPKT